MNKTAIGVLILILVVLVGGFYLWSRPDVGMDTDPEMGVSGQVIAPEGQIPETADLETELNASGSDTSADIQQLEAEFNAG